MADFLVDYTWDTSHPAPLLFVNVSGRVLAERNGLAQIIDQAHALVEQQGAEQVSIVYDITRTERRLPLDVLMSRTQQSPRVREVFVVGARSRMDEMAVLIMGAAKRLPYPISFYRTLELVQAELSAREARLH